MHRPIRKKTVINLLLLMLLMITIQGKANPGFGIAGLNDVGDHVIWDRTPITVVLGVSHERMITFPGPISVHNTNPELSSDKLSILNNNGTLYLTAKKTFTPIRLAITLTSTGEVILLDISATSNGQNTPLNILLAQSENIPSPISNASPSQITDQSTASIHYITLMRYAISHLYAPERLVKESNRITRAPMYTQKSVPLVAGSSLTAMPLISWQGGDLYVTAILLKNATSHPLTINPDQIQGQWLAASLYPNRTLTPAGTLNDRTTLFLISTSNFNDALHALKDYRL